MTESPRRSRFWLYAPVVVVLLLAVAWSGVWFYASQRAETVISAWIAREASLGRKYECAERKVGGYPFRIEVRCTDLTVTLDSPDGVVTLRTPRLLALAQIYQPDLVIAEATGPMTVKQAETGIDYVATWSLLQTSVRGRPSAPQRLSLQVSDPKLTFANGQDAIADAKAFGFHARRKDGAAEPVFDLAINLDALTLHATPGIARQPIVAEATGILRGLKDLRPKPMRTRLREWQANNGRIEITNARVTQGEMIATGKGELGLGAGGRPVGTLDLRVAGLEKIAGALFNQGEGSRSSSGLIAWLNMLSRSEIDGKRAVAVPLSFREGRVFFGPIPIGRTSPLF